MVGFSADVCGGDLFLINNTHVSCWKERAGARSFRNLNLLEIRS